MNRIMLIIIVALVILGGLFYVSNLNLFSTTESVEPSIEIIEPETTEPESESGSGE